jgi:hypothetical protein
MTARQEIEQRLRAMSPNEYVAFRKSFGGSAKPPPGQSLEEWKDGDIEKLVTFLPQNNPKAWSALLHQLGVLSDPERAAQGSVTAADEARRANELAAQANRLSQEANEIAKTAKGESKLAIILSIIAGVISLIAAVLVLINNLADSAAR